MTDPHERVGTRYTFNIKTFVWSLLFAFKFQHSSCIIYSNKALRKFAEHLGLRILIRGQSIKKESGLHGLRLFLFFIFFGWYK